MAKTHLVYNYKGNRTTIAISASFDSNDALDIAQLAPSCHHHRAQSACRVIEVHDTVTKFARVDCCIRLKLNVLSSVELIVASAGQ